MRRFCKLQDIAKEHPQIQAPKIGEDVTRVREDEILELSRAQLEARFDGVSSGCYDRSAGWSSLVARWAHNPKVGGSNPPPATNAIIELRAIGHLQQLSKTVQ